MTVDLIPASARHVTRIAARMRPVDALECRAMGHEPKDALRLGLLGSTLAWTALVDGLPEAMLGVSPVSVVEGVGRPWLLGSHMVPLNPRALLWWAPVVLHAMSERFARLENWVAAENGAAIRLLIRLGFVFPAANGVEHFGGVVFRRFCRSQPPTQIPYAVQREGKHCDGQQRKVRRSDEGRGYRAHDSEHADDEYGVNLAAHGFHGRPHARAFDSTQGVR